MSKAFDKVPHERLALKLHHYGIRGSVLTWLQSFLRGRSQQVVLDGYYSTPCDVISGVPQGSVLDPTLFLIYINDIVDGIQSIIRLFADDCLIYRRISSPADQCILQKDLKRLSTWASTWQMDFNVGKYNIMQFSNINARHKSSLAVLQLLKISHPFVIPGRIYDFPKLKKWMCELRTFLQIQSHICYSYVLLNKEV